MESVYYAYACICICLYVRAIRMICQTVLMTDTSLVFFLQATLCSQGLAASCDVPYPVFEIFWKLGAFDLLVQGKNNKLLVNRINNVFCFLRTKQQQKGLGKN